MAPRDPSLEPVEDRRIALRYLHYAVDLKEIVTLVEPSLNFSFTADALSFSEESLQLELGLEPGFLASLNYEQMEALRRPAAEIRFSYGVSSVWVFAHGRVEAVGEKGLRLSVDLPVYKLQRREALRMRVREDHGAVVNLHGLDFPIHDLSAGGLSVVVPMVDERLFAPGLKIPPTTVTFLGKDWRVGLEIVSATPTKFHHGPALKIGFRMVRMPPGLEREIAKEAYLVSHQIWSRWI